MGFWLRVGDDGDIDHFDDLLDLLAYLNALHVGTVIGWTGDGCETPSYHGTDYIRITTTDLRHLSPAERATVANGLEEAYV